MKKMRIPIFILLAILLSFASCEQQMYNLDGINNVGNDLEYDDSKANLRMNIAAVSLICSEVKSVNISSVESMITLIKNEHPDIEMIVFGETILGHYYNDENPLGYQLSIAESIPGESSAYIANLARVNNVNIVFGMGEKKDGLIYNALVFIDSGGNTRVVSRKQVLIEKDVSSGYASGVSGNFIDLKGIRFGFMICSDNNSMDIIKKFTSNNIDVVVHIVAGGGEDQQISYARTVNAWMIQANRYGSESSNFYSGFSGISAPTGITKNSIFNSQGYTFYNVGIYK